MFKVFVIRAITFFIIAGVKGEVNIEEYLIKFGFLNESDIGVTNIEQALVNFQEYYALPVDGTLNNETERLMEQPRCGVLDNPSPFKIHATKWNKTNLKWYFPLSNQAQKLVVAKAFKVWENISNLRFSESYANPDIVISFTQNVHNYHPKCAQAKKCSYNFDGVGGVLAHAFFPDGINGCVDIHLDKAEPWYFGVDNTPEGKTGLYYVMLHEIGHSLGLEHSTQTSAIMYPYYREDEMIPSDDDVLAISFLYGTKIPQGTTSTQRTKVTIPKPKFPNHTSTPTPKSPDLGQASPDLCKILPQKMLITSNHHFYIFYNEWVWVLEIGESKYRKPILLKDYLPSNILSSSSFSSSNIHIYQRVDDNIMLIMNDVFYLLEFPALTIKNGYDGISIRNLGLQTGSKINAIFSTYSGKCYIFHDDYYYVEIGECTLTVKSRGLIKNLFPEIPTDVNRVFKYINGHLYFFRNNTYYEFNEFSNKLIRAGNFDFSLFNINCSQESIIQQIKQLLLRLKNSV